jgi:hypothetical protein
VTQLFDESALNLFVIIIQQNAQRNQVLPFSGDPPIGNLKNGKINEVDL